MAQRKKKERETKYDPKTEVAFGDWKFVRHTMTRDEKAAFREWELSAEELVSMIDRLVDGDYKLSIALDEYNKCCSATLACRGLQNEDHGLILSGRASSAFDALKVVLYKHHILLSGSWLAFQEREDGEDILG